MIMCLSDIPSNKHVMLTFDTNGDHWCQTSRVDFAECEKTWSICNSLKWSHLQVDPLRRFVLDFV